MHVQLGAVLLVRARASKRLPLGPQRRDGLMHPFEPVRFKPRQGVSEDGAGENEQDARSQERSRGAGLHGKPQKVSECRSGAV
jgi:hypothetical protein